MRTKEKRAAKRKEDKQVKKGNGREAKGWKEVKNRVVQMVKKS